VNTSVNGPEVLSYWFNVQHGSLVVLMDDREYRFHGPAKGLESWQRSWLTIPPGSHRVSWKYEPYLSSGPPALLDEVRLMGEGRVFIRTCPEITPLMAGSFQFAVPFSGASVRWAAEGLPDGLGINASTGTITGVPARRSVWPLKLRLYGSSGDSDEILATLDASIPIEEALDWPNSWWNSGEEPGARWFGQNLASHDGSDAVRSPRTPQGKSRSLTTSVAGPGTLRWWWQIPAASAGDRCLLTLDGSRKLSEIKGPGDWRQEEAVIPGGYHELSWNWITDDAGDPAEESVTVDSVGFGP